MIECNQLNNFGFKCKSINPALLFVQTPLSLAFDGQAIGFYIQDIGSGTLRLSDNADTLFTAQSHGIKVEKKTKKIDTLAHASGIAISEKGELYTTCTLETLTYHSARMIEAADRIGQLLNLEKPKPTGLFDKEVYRILKPAFDKKLKRDYEITGASGHQIKFPFFLKIDNPKYISTIACDDKGKPNWSSVYQTVGKMIDIRNAEHEGMRIVIMEHGEEEDIQKAERMLVESASIIVLDNPEKLIEILAA